MGLKQFVVASMLAATGMSAVSCHDPGAYAPSAVSEFLQFETSANSMPADGNSRIILTATIDQGATTGNRTITFQTTAGTLIASGQQSTAQIEVPIDASGRAVAELQAGSSVLTCRLTAKIKDFVVTRDVLFTAPDPDSVLVLNVSPATIPADGFSRARLTAMAKQPSDPSQRSVTFKTSTGTLFSAAERTGTAGPLAVAADANGIAVAELQSTQVVETAFVSATAAGITRTASVNFEAANPANIITVATSRSTAPADGATVVQVVATIAAGLRNREVTFTTTDGTFSNGTKSMSATADGANHAIVDLKSPTLASVAFVRGTVSSVSASATINFTQAQPESILVSPAAAQMRSTATNTISVSLFRQIGVPSAGIVVAYSAKDPAGNTIGGFGSILPTSSTAGGSSATSSAVYDPGGTTYTGPVIIQATVGSVTGSATITIVP